MLIPEGEHIQETKQETINARVARYRNEKKLTQQQVADKMGLKCSTYSQMERNGNITAEKLLLLEEVLDTPLGTLLYGQEVEFKAKKTILPLGAPTIEPPKPDELFLTNNEKNYIKILRNIPKEARNEVIALLQQKYDECSKKRSKSTESK